MNIAQTIEEYGVESVLGKRILSARECRDFRLSKNIAMFYQVRGHAMRTDLTYWDRFCETYTNALSALEWAEKEYKEFTNG